MSAKNRTTAIFVIALVVALAGVVVAAGPGNPARVIPYRGHIDIAGVPYSGATDVTFHLYDDADPAQSTLSWSETLNVTANGGVFAVILGQDGTPIPEAAFASADLFLGVDIAGTPLVGTQRIAAAPMAIRADHAYALDVDTDVTVGGSVSAASLNTGGGLIAASVNATSVTASAAVNAASMNATGDVGAGSFTTAGSNVLGDYARTNRIVLRRVDQDVINNGNAYRNIALTSRFAQGVSGNAACGGHCIGCFSDAAGGGSRTCADASGNRNCLCVNREE